MGCKTRKGPHVDLEIVLARLRYEPDTGHFYWVSSPRKDMVGKRAGTVRPDGYRQVVVKRRCYLEQNLAWWMHHGEWMPDGLSVDHINRVPDDNRIANLRLLTPTGQVHNRAYKGYWFDKRRNKFYAGVRRKGKYVHGGTFATEEEAAAKAAELKL